MKSWERLISALRRLPGIGPKQAQRLALHILRASPAEVREMIVAIEQAVQSVKPCSLCSNFAESEKCRICSDEGRDSSVLCVVENPPDVDAVERSKSFRGLYHVLHGSISPLEGIGPELLKIDQLVERVSSKKGHIREVILATDPDTEGETTAIHIARKLKPLGVKVTRIALGLPLGASLDYTDELTLSHALTGRKEI